MKHPSNRGDRRLAASKERRKVDAERFDDAGYKSRERGPDFDPAERDRKAAKARERKWKAAAQYLPPGAEELTLDELYLGGKAAGGEKYLRFG